MTDHDRDQAQHDIGVGERYRSVSNERAPERLNRQVLTLAAQAVQGQARKRFAWFNPLTATAALALSAVIAFTVNRNQLSAVVENPYTEGWSEVTKDASARLRELGNTAVGQTTTEDPALRDLANSEAPGSCDQDAVSSVARWQACIAALRAAGHDAQAADEVARLQRAHPEAARDER